MTSPKQVDPKVLDKIKKCLALAESDNPNEAATALRQAQALMRKYGLSADAMLMADIGEAELKVRTMSRNKPAMWECALASIVAEAFGCKLMVARVQPQGGKAVPVKELNKRGRFIFVGHRHSVEIASYTTEVLVRKCQKSRTAFIRDKLSGLGTVARKLSTKAGDEFARGWVAQISRLVNEFAGEPDLEKAIDAYIDGKKNFDDPPVRGMDSDAERDTPQGRLLGLAGQFGVRAAKNERLHRPMSGTESQQLLLA